MKQAFGALAVGFLMTALAASAAAQGKEKKTEDEKANNSSAVKFMVRGYCYAASKQKDDEALGGFGGSKNFHSAIPKDVKTQPGKLQLIAQPEVVTRFGKAKGMRLLLVNTTETPATLSASDSRLSIVQEAKDTDGEWKPIEYLPSSFCGNSYHRVFLPAGHHWAFAAPRYEGPIKTQIRFRLSMGKQAIYSNVFEGSVHRDQFTVKQGHDRTGLMDPYND